ncbi:MFS general substrate transporter [Rhizopogon vinicolor AM-OR11-026]|uniref:MFS general substrate transporter n=1 Tax=Rhizopogon vinicolor AM-OR11-026 TaxID=1314800 RepID=A0A1B7N1K1_9AGAM|nr:MFS general substrate transporter [Rhizopogon vinicolor AM-OR11-026]
MSGRPLRTRTFIGSAFGDGELGGYGWQITVTASDNEKKASHKSVIDLGEAPDGGLRAWLVVVAVSLVLFSTFGVIGAWGVFQAYYEEHLLSDLSPSTISWIGSVQYALVYIPALATGRLFDLGYFKIPCFATSCVLVACTFVIAECTQYWQFFLVQGLVTGVSCGIIISPALVVVSHWFSPKRRGFALGVAAVGSSAGSTLFPAAAQNLIPLIGFKWTVRVFGFILIATLGAANILIERRLPPSNIHGGLFNLKAFRNKAFTFYCISGIMVSLGLLTELTYMSVSAVEIGVSEDFSFYIISISNAASAVGCLSAGIIGDKIGAINIMAPSMALAGIMTFVWPFAKTESQLIAVTAIYGFSCGAFISLHTVPAVAMGEIEDAGHRVGMFMSLAALGAIAGPPISGALISPTGGFVMAGYYAGGTIMVSVVLLLVTRYLQIRRLWGKF